MERRYVNDSKSFEKKKNGSISSVLEIGPIGPVEDFRCRLYVYIKIINNGKCHR